MLTVRCVCVCVGASDWTGGPFRWQTHLVRTRSLPVPAKLFRPRPVVSLRPGMRVEAVDVRVRTPASSGSGALVGWVASVSPTQNR